MSTARRVQADKVLADYAGIDAENDDDLERFLLIERNVSHGDPPYWQSTHPSPEAASAYHHNQEYAVDWAIEALVDLDTGRHYLATTSTAFEAMP